MSIDDPFSARGGLNTPAVEAGGGRESPQAREPEEQLEGVPEGLVGPRHPLVGGRGWELASLCVRPPFHPHLPLNLTPRMTVSQAGYQVTLGN